MSIENGSQGKLIPGSRLEVPVMIDRGVSSAIGARVEVVENPDGSRTETHVKPDGRNFVTHQIDAQGFVVGRFRFEDKLSI